MANYEIYDKQVIFTDGNCGAILLADEYWYSFRYFDDGDLDIDDIGFAKPSEAYKKAKELFT